MSNKRVFSSDESSSEGSSSACSDIGSSDIETSADEYAGTTDYYTVDSEGI